MRIKLNIKNKLKLDIDINLVTIINIITAFFKNKFW